MPITRVKAAIEAIKNGQMVVMIDDEDRENEGDLVYAATFSTPALVNFMASEAKGLICATLTVEIATRLGLTPMVRHNNSQHETAFTVSVDARECTTGISAHERDMTIKILADALSSESDLVKPGHIFPLVAKDGGVLVRTGHTEGSVDLCKLAGLAPVGVICEIMNPDGSMARRGDLDGFAKKHDLRTVYISDLVEYRMRHETLLHEIGRTQQPFLGHPARKIVYRDHHGLHHTVFCFGELRKRMKVKYHNIQPDITLLCDHAKYQALLHSVELIAKEGGVVVFLDSRLQDGTEIRDIGIGSQILVALGIEELELITTRSKRDYIALGGFGLSIASEIIIDH